jgi:adenine phosphoribosyltransferase
MKKLECDLASLVRTIPDYPRSGILFRDITTLLSDAQGLQTSIDGLAAPFQHGGIDLVAGIEARGFILGGAVACALGVGFIPIRKRGKLPLPRGDQRRPPSRLSGVRAESAWPLPLSSTCQIWVACSA